MLRLYRAFALCLAFALARRLFTVLMLHWRRYFWTVWSFLFANVIFALELRNYILDFLVLRLAD